MYLVTKYAAGGDLLHYCLSQENSRKWMNEERALHICLQLAQGLRDMHEVNLVHRDLKLLNVFMCDSSEMPRVKLGDLGLAVRLSPGESIIKRAGTVAFMAPEVLAEKATAFKSDIWSLGIIMYTLLVSHLPFTSDLYTEKRQKELLELEIPYEGADWESISPESVDCLKHMLIKDQKERYSIQDVLAHPCFSSMINK